MATCWKCGKENGDDLGFCLGCGTSLVQPAGGRSGVLEVTPAGWTCEKCQHENRGGVLLCAQCGVERPRASDESDKEVEEARGQTTDHGELTDDSGNVRQGESSLIGEMFDGRFRIERLLGSGRMGAVYLAKHTVLDRQFALKIMREELLGDLSFATKFVRKMRSGARIENPHIAYVFDFGQSDEGRLYIVMEYVQGLSLAKVMARDGRFPVPRALHVLSQIAGALGAAHADNMVQQDLRPENVVLTNRQGQQDFVKLLNFGLAKIVTTETRFVGHVLTADEGTSLAPEHTSPEEVLGGTVDHRVDIYGFGVLAFEMLVGTVPFPFRGNVAQVLAAHVNQQPPVPSVASGRKDIPPALDAMVLRCLAKRPDDRYPSAETLQLVVRYHLGEKVSMPFDLLKQVDQDGQHDASVEFAQNAQNGNVAQDIQGIEEDDFPSGKACRTTNEESSVPDDPSEEHFQDREQGAEAGRDSQHDAATNGDIRQGESSLIGEMFADRFRIERFLRKGGMGAVYLAKHTARL